MNIKFYGVLFCAMCAIHPMVCGAATVHVPDGATVSIDGTRNNTFTVNGSSVKNVVNNILVADGDATFVFEYPSGTTSGGLYCGLVATNGTVTLDLTAIDGREFVLDYGASVKGDGVLRVKGRDSICLGGTYANGAPADVVNLEYVDATDAPYAEPEGLILTNQFLEWNLPTTTPWHLAVKATPIIIKSDSAIASLLMKNGTLTLTNRELIVFNPVALPPSATPIAIGNGGILTLVPRSVTESTYFEQAGGAGTFTNSFNIAAGGELNLSGRNTIVMKGAISGSGTLRFTASADNNNATTTVHDADSFTGEVICETAGNTLAFTGASPGAGGNNVTLLKDGCLLRLGTSATDGYAGSIGTLTGPATGSATLTLPNSKAGTLTIASRTGNVTINGAGYDKTTVVLGSVKVGETVVVDAGDFKYELDAAALSSPGVFALTRTNGRNVYMRSANAMELDFLDFAVPSTGSYKLVAADGVTYQNVPENVCLEVGSGVSAALAAQTNVETRVRLEGGSLDVSRYTPDFTKNILYWMDPSDRSSVVSTNEHAVSRIYYPSVAGMNDTRVEQTSVKLVPTKVVESTQPTLITNGVNGLNYLSFDTGGNRRLKFGNAIAPKFAIMVFGSQNGGGKAIIGNTSDYYVRGGTPAYNMSAANPIFANGDIATWVNGEQVNPSSRNLSGGWEIISFDTSGASVHGLGFSGGFDTPANTRGQNYGEVLLFSQTPTEAERVAAEKYLAQKWGLLADYHEAEQTVPSIRVEGNGSITLSADVELSGSFAGTVNMNGNALSVAADPLPPGEEAVVSEGRLAWFDPDCTESIDIGNQRVNNIYDREAGKADGAPVLNGSGRSPYVLNGARGFGPSRRWVNYCDSSYYGRTMRLNRYPTTGGTGVAALSAQTVFLVQDSSKGGGSPFLSAVNGSGNILSRLTNYDAMSPDPGWPVWRGTTASLFATGSTYLDGHAIDGAVEGFQGRPELLTAVGGSSFNLGAFAYYGYLTAYYQAENPPSVDAGEIQGEIIVYDCALTEADRKGVEAYLMWKWLGTARDGYSVMTNITVSGGGRLNVESFAQMPKIGSSFTGTLALSETSFAFTVTAEGTVEGALSGGSGTLELPAACTANVTLERGVPPGEYALISGGSIAPGTDWTLNLVETTPRIVSLEVRGGAPLLVVRKKGAVFTVR